MKTKYTEALNRIELEDYIAIKTKAYQFYLKYKDQGIDFKIISEILNNNLGYIGNEPEAILISSTMLLPDDQKFVDLYKENGYDLAKVQSHYSILDNKNLMIKEYEFNHFGLEQLIETGVLKPISSENVMPSVPKK